MGVRSTDDSDIDDRRGLVSPAKFGSALGRARWKFGGPMADRSDTGVGEGGGGGSSSRSMTPAARAQAGSIVKKRKKKGPIRVSLAEAMNG